MLLKLNEVAREIGISYPTLKQWIYRGKVRTVKTLGGHHRISEEELKRLLGTKILFSGGKGRAEALATGPSRKRVSTRSKLGKASRREGISHPGISGRNKLVGAVKEIEFDGLLARVVLAIGSQSITAIITREACAELGLKIGEKAAALIKATEVMILK